MGYCASVWLVGAIFALISVGAVLRSGLWRGMLDGKMTEALVSALAVAGVCDVALILLALMPGSPLLSVTGGLFPSPWLAGLFPSVCFELVLVSIVYGLVSGYIRGLLGILSVLTYGISRWPWIILIALCF